MRVNKNLVFALIMTFILTWLGSLLFRREPAIWTYLIVFLISYPWRTSEGNVFSLWGGFSDEDIVSLFAIFQSAKVNALNIFGVCLYQRGTQIVQIIGLNIIQWGDTTVDHLFGFVFLQKGWFIEKHLWSVPVFTHNTPDPHNANTELSSCGGLK